MTVFKNPVKSRFFWPLVLVSTIVAAGVLLLLWRSLGDSGASIKKMGTYTVRRGDLTIGIIESGDIKAVNSKDLKSEVEGRTTIISIVDEGTIITPEDVNKGMILAELDSSAIKEKLTQQEIKFLSSEASYADAIESLDIQEKQNKSDIQAGRMKVRFALMDFKKYLGEEIAGKLIEQSDGNPGLHIDMTKFLKAPKLGGAALQKLKQLSDEITLAESKFERASDKLAWTRRLYEKKYVAETELKADELEVQSLKVKKERAEIALELFELYEFLKESEKLFSDYKEAELELERIEAGARSKFAQAKARLGSTEATYALEKERLERFQRQFEACIIRAPSPGQVVYSSSMLEGWMRQRRLIEVGAEVRERQKIISIPDATKMKVVVKVHETWIGKINIGQSAKITIAAFPEKTFTGQVLRKAPLADPQQWMNPDLKLYSTDVSIDGTHDNLKTGMTAKVEIVVDELKDILSVPLQAVVNHDGKKICFLMDGDKPVQRQVETGAFNDDFVEIKSGLDDGDKVLLNPPRLKSEKNKQ